MTGRPTSSPGRRPRILHVIDTGGPGGAETILLELVRGLDRMGWESVVAVSVDDWLANELRALGIHAIIISKPQKTGFRYALALHRLVRDPSIDLIHTHLFAASFYANLAATGRSTPVVSTIHGEPEIAGQSLVGLKSFVYRRPRSHLVAVSDSLKSYLQERLHHSLDIHRIHNGIDVDAFRPGPSTLRDDLGISTDTPLIGAVGNIRPSKAYEDLLKALSILSARQPGVQLVIAGQGDNELHDRLKEAARQMSVTDRVHFLGFRADVANVLRGLDCFALPSRNEGFSLATVQAMAVGVPVVATRCGGPEEIVDDGITGRLVPVSDPKELAATLHQALDDRTTARKLSEAARQTAQEKFSLDAMLDRYVELYERVIAGARSDGRPGLTRSRSR